LQSVVFSKTRPRPRGRSLHGKHSRVGRGVGMRWKPHKRNRNVAGVPH
jgi:hypothetical protein